MSMRHWKADFGFIPPAETTLQQEFQVKSVPTLMMVYFDPTAEEGKQLLAPQYQGLLRFGAMKGWLEAIMITLKVEKRGLPSDSPDQISKALSRIPRSIF